MSPRITGRINDGAIFPGDMVRQSSNSNMSAASQAMFGHAQPQQQQHERMVRSSQQTQQARQPSTEAAPQQPSSSQQLSQPQPSFHLTPDAKLTVREVVLSALHHPTGEVDPGCLQRAMAKGWPKEALLSAVAVGRQRDRTNREERREKGGASAATESACIEI